MLWLDRFVQHEEVNPLGHDFIGARINNLMKKPHFIDIQRQAPQNRGIAYLIYFTVDYDDLGSRFTPLGFAVDMHGMVLKLRPASVHAAGRGK